MTILLLATSLWSYHIASDDPGSWPRILSSLGFTAGASGIHVVGPNADASVWLPRIEQGAIVILEGPSPMAAALGILPKSGRRTPVRSILDFHQPKLEIIWQQAVPLPETALPPDARVFAKEKWAGLPVAAGLRRGQGAVLWLATPPGERGYERYPYLAQALADLGAEPPLRSRNLWAFLDTSYRSRVDLDYFAARWRNAGISMLHLAAWHFWERDPERDAWLARLIAACHRNAITVYAWVEFPHVSERFWNEHPEWREKTATGQDAQLDWRRLMNLRNAACSQAVARGLGELLWRFEWDGVNLAELYFESLEGHSNAARFTPMNDDVRAEFRAAHGFDPRELFPAANPARLRTFLDWRAQLAARLQQQWLGEIERIRFSRPDLGVVLTHIDDRHDTSMRDSLGADTARTLPLLGRHDFHFLVEDPATIWHLGPDRYREIAARYADVSRPDRLAIDINIVERYQDVYPTKQQTGVELFQLVQAASRVFPRVALYFENSLLPVDLPWLGSAAATPDRREVVGGKLVLESKKPVGVPWKGPAKVNGSPWPWTDGEVVWLPAGAHAIEPSARAPTASLVDFNGSVISIQEVTGGLELAYRSDSTAWAVLEGKVAAFEMDGEAAMLPVTAMGSRSLVRLPRGQHLVRAWVAQAAR